MKKDIMQRVKHIEKDYPVEEIRYKEIPIWPFIRHDLFSQYYLSDAQEVSQSPQKGKKHWRIWNSVKNSSIFLFIKKEKDIVFTSTLQYRKESNGKTINQLTSTVEDLVEDFIPIIQFTKPFSSAPYKKCIDNRLIDYLCSIRAKLYPIKKNEIAGYEILDSIIDELDISFDYKRFINQMYQGVKVYLKWFHKVKPKRLFIECYYDSKMPAIYAAKKLGIMTVELQHGQSNEKDFAYHSYVDIKDNPYPDYFLCFGQRFKDILISHIYTKTQIVITGHNYLSLVAKNQEFNKTIFRNKYDDIEKQKIIIAVAGQPNVDKQLYDFFVEVAEREQDFYIIYCPRNLKEYHKDREAVNFRVETDLNIYQLIQCAAVTCGVYSTALLESLYLGTPVVSFDETGMAEYSFGMLLEGISSFHYAKTMQEVCLWIRKFVVLDKDIVRKEGHLIFEDNYKERLATFLNTH